MFLAPADEKRRETGAFGQAALSRSATSRAVITVLFLLGLAIVLIFPKAAWGQTEGELRLPDAPDLSIYEGRHLDLVEVKTLGPLWSEQITVRAVKAGDEISGQLIRRALRELDRSGRFAELRAELREEGGRIALILFVRPRRLIDGIRFEGGRLERSEESRALALRNGDAVTDVELSRARERLVNLYRKSGYTRAEITLSPEEIDDPRKVLLRVRVDAHSPQEITRLRFLVTPMRHHPDLRRSIESYDLQEGDRLDEEAALDADRALEEALVLAKFYEATVSHKIEKDGRLAIFVDSGPRFSVRVEGNDALGAGELEGVMRLVEERDPRPELLEQLVREHYIKHGFADASLRVERFDDEAGLVSEIYLWVREGKRFRIRQRVYPCLSGARTAKELDAEIEGVLSEHFPPVGILAAVNGAAIDHSTGSPSASARPRPWQAEPWSSYSRESYEAVMEHLRDLYRADGYLDVQIGPATIVRRQCRAGSPPGECIVEEAAPSFGVDCADIKGSEQGELRQTCEPDASLGIRCESEGTLVLPIQVGRQTILYDVSVEGNAAFSEQEVLDLAGLPVGAPFRRAQLDAALRRIRDRYDEEAFAFAQIDSEIELSADHTRARLTIGITERHQVMIRRIDIRGALITREGLVRSRLSLKVGGKYSRSLVRRSREQLQSLAVFTNVTIALQDPGVPAREKVVIITVHERLPQYLDITGGFGSVDGFRIGFEYGHRNLGGNAIQLTLRSQLAIRPPFLIAEKDVREKYEELTNLERLERRNTITLAFPEIGLGPLFRFEVELLDLGENQRDFIHTRDAAALRLLFRPRRAYLVQLGGTIEINDATILGGGSYEDFYQENGQNVTVPEGRSVAYTQNLSASWDARDKPLSATRGFFLGGGIEHVHAVPLAESEGECNVDSTQAFDSVCSDLLRYSGRAAVYIPMGKTKMTLALSFRAGTIQHLTDISRTYPDRLFFMGGVDTLRGYPRYSLVPQDLADLVLDESNEFTINEVVLRGGDLFVNPRAELRIPLMTSIQTAFFVDAGNLWYDQSNFEPFNLRYTVGTGLRIATPVGPLVFDYGFNVERLANAFGITRGNERDWEDIGAFHFSIGLF